MKNKNFLLKVPTISQDISWNMENEKIVITVENRGIANRLMQMLIKKPKSSKIHLDEMGSFVWVNIDGKKTIFDISNEVNKKFGQSAQPLYLRIEKYFKSLYDCHFIVWAKQ